MADLPNDWSSPSQQPQAVSKNQPLIEDFIDDFDDDDDAFFNTQPTQPEDDAATSFGMLALNYELPRSTAATDSEKNNIELQEMEPHLSALRNINSSYRSVSTSCLIIHQSLYRGKSPASIIVHHKNYEQYTQAIIESLSACLSHHIPAARILAAKTLGMFSRASLAKCDFDPRLLSEVLEDRIQDDCLGAAYTLINVILDEDDAVSSAALESLGIFILDAQSDSLAAEVYALSENGDPNSLLISTDPLPSPMKHVQFKVYNHVLFPRMSKILNRLSLYTSHQLGKCLPILTAAFESALTEGEDTVPARRALFNTKVTHGKRGWFETDVLSLVKDYVEIILGCFDKKDIRRAASLACLRLANVCPLASWRGKVSRCAVNALIGILNEETALITSEKNGDENKESALSFAGIPTEMIGGTVSLLLIALRGIPLHERAAGLVSALRAVMLFIPMGVQVTTVKNDCRRLDVPLCFVDGENCVQRLGRTALLTEIALLVMVDGKCDVDHLKTDELIERTISDEDSPDKYKEQVLGARAMLMNHILQTYHLSSIWDTQQKKNNRVFRPVDELIWVFCSTLLQLSQHSEYAFSKDFSYLIEWANIALVVLDNFGKFVCRPVTPSPFSHAAHASYLDLMTCLMKKSGLVPSPNLSIRENMLPSAFLADNDIDSSASAVSNRFDLSVVGGPGRQMPNVSSALSKICQNISVLWSKARTAYPLTEESLSDQAFGNILLGAAAVDAWLGKCIINHDAKRSNEGQLELASSLLAIFHTEMDTLLESHGVQPDSKSTLSAIAQDNPACYFNATIHLFRVCMASLETVAKMSVILWHIESRQTKDDVEVLEDKVAPLAVSILHTVIETSKDALDSNAKKGRDVMVLSLYQQVATDANDTIARIVESSPAYAKRQTQHDDIAVLFQPSPFLLSPERSKGKIALENLLQMIMTCSVNTAKQEKKASFNDLSFVKELSPTLISQLPPMHQCSLFLYHHARLVVTRLVSNVCKVSMSAFPTNVVGPPKDVHSLNPHRLLKTFQHSKIEMYRSPGDLHVLIPSTANQERLSKTYIGNEPVVLTGCSDPVSLTMSYRVERIRGGDLSEKVVLLVTMRLYNITPVPIRRNGIKLDLRIMYENDYASNSVASALYRNEIKGGEFVTWETKCDNVKASNILLKASITFRDMDRESITHKWVSLHDDIEGNSFIEDEEDGATDDIILTCRTVRISAVEMLQPCPLVFYASMNKRISGGLGDASAFQFLWSRMRYECSKTLVFPGTGELKLNGRREYVLIETQDSNKPGSGYAFITPEGLRVLCILEEKANNSHLLRVRSESEQTLRCLVRMDAQSSLMSFLFGADAAGMSSSEIRPKLEHDFASITMPHHQLEHDFASMTMPHHEIGHDYASVTMAQHDIMDVSQ